MIDLASPFFLFFNVTATTDIYTLSLHDALPILHGGAAISRRAELPGQHRGQTDADLHRLDRADVCVEPDGTASRVGARRIGRERNAGGITDCWEAVRRRSGSRTRSADPGAASARSSR